MRIILFDIDYTIFDTKRFKESRLTEFHSYEEVPETLLALRENFRLGIFSEGDKAFQEKKLRETDLAAFFDPGLQFIVPDKKEALREVVKALRGEEIVFMVDDKLKILAELKTVFQEMQTVWVKRGFYAERATPVPGFTPDFTVLTITDLPSLFAA